MHKIVIGFHGVSGSGCTIAARELAILLDARRRSISGPIGAIADDFGITPLEAEVWKDHGIPWLGGMTPRTFVRMFHRGFRRAFGPDFLAAHLFRQVARSEDALTVVDDVRSLADTTVFAQLDMRTSHHESSIRTLLVHVDRPGLVVDAGDEIDVEASQVDPNLFVDTLVNDSDPAALAAGVGQLLDRLRFRYPVLRPRG